MTPEQIEERRQKDRIRYANRTPEQIEERKQYQKNYDKKNSKKLKNYQKIYSKKEHVVNKRKIYQATRRQLNEVIDYHKKYNKDNAKKLNQNKRDYNKDRRFTVCLTYSERHSNSKIPCCRCCGENSDIRFLAIDHIQGRENLPKKEAGLVGDKLISFLIRKNFPEGYQVLCHNCNSAKGHSKDNTCPHERQ
jgi:hypothetical protein